MKMLCKLFILLICTAGMGIAVAEDNCHKDLRHLAAMQGLFVQCSTTHSVPVKMCKTCEGNYTEMTIAYDSLLKEQNCSEQYFNKDRIHIISTTQSILTGLWDKAYCDDCFTSNHSSIFEEKLNTLETCFTKYPHTECIDCIDIYTDLNNFYISNDQHNNGKVCYDMQDSMNRTRTKWSNELKCCRREFNMLLFLIATSFVGMLPILFYGGTFALSKHRERNHGILNEDPELDTATTSTTAILPRETVLPVTDESTKKRATFYEDSDDDEYNSDNDKPKKSKQAKLTETAFDSSSDDSDDNVHVRKKL